MSSASMASMIAGSVTGLATLASWLGAPAPPGVDGRPPYRPARHQATALVHNLGTSQWTVRVGDNLAVSG